MKKLMIVTLMAVAALTASAQRRSPTRRGAAGADGRAALAQGKVIQFGRKVLLGSACLQAAPTANGNSAIPKVFKGQRRWIVPELEYQTAVDWLDEVTFTWHILLDSKKAKQRDKPAKDKEPVPQYSYYTVAVRYVNVPKGSHMASVVLPPSVLERFGETVAVSVVVTDKDGEFLTDVLNEGVDTVMDRKLVDKWWENSDQVMSAKDAKGTPRIARRQGLLDRSKTIFALISPDDYETVQQ